MMVIYCDDHDDDHDDDHHRDDDHHHDDDHYCDHFCMFVGSVIIGRQVDNQVGHASGNP